MRPHVARIIRRSVLCLLAAAWCTQASAQTSILDDVHTVATNQTGAPVEHTFQVFAAGTYSITLTDVGAQSAAPVTPMPLASLKMALTANDALVGTPVVVEGGTPSGTTPGVGVLTFTAAAAGTYRIHVIGAPASGHPAGPINLAVVNATTNTPLQSWTDLIAPPSQALPATEALLQDTVQISSAGTYQIALADLALPHTLGTLSLIFIDPQTDTSYILPDPTNGGALQRTVTLQTGTYQIYVVAQVAGGATGGLFSTTVTAATSAPAYAKAVPVGTTVQVGTSLPLSAGTYTLTLEDLAFPTPLKTLSAALISAGQAVPISPLTAGPAATQFGAGESGTFSVSTSATYQLFAAATAATAAPGAGSYAAQIALQGGAVVFSGTQAVVTSGGSAVAYSFSTTVASAGSYTTTLTDFQTPSAVAVGDFAVVQNGAIVGAAQNAPGTISVNLAAAPLTILAILEGGTGGSVLDVNLADASGSLVFDQPQGVGLVLTPTQITIPTASTYQFTLADLQWPAPFGTIAGIVTQGSTLVGRIYGGGTLNAIKAGPGNYFVNILATPAAAGTNPDDAGTYVLNVSQAPPAPTVTLTADATSVSAGSTVHLIWTTTNATSCAASGSGWSGTFVGAQAASDTATSPAITAAATFTLTCTGPGGTLAGSVNVAVAAATSKGGGGVLDIWMLLALVAMVRLRRVLPLADRRPA